MKKNHRLIRTVIAGLMIAALLPGSAFAAQGTVIKRPKTEQAVIKVQDIKDNDTFTLEEAYVLAKANNSSLKTLADQIDLMEDNKEKIFQSSTVRPGRTPSLEERYMMEAADLSILTAIKDLDYGLESSKYSKEMTEQGVEASIMSCFISIKDNEESLALAQKAFDLETKALEEAQLKLKLGVISEADYTKMETEHEQSQKNIEMLQLSIKTDYVNLKRLMGLNNDREISIDYEVEFEPYHLEEGLDQYINKVIDNDPYLKIKKEAAENKKFQVSFYTNNGESYKSKETTYKEAERTYAEDKKEMRKQLMAAANQLSQLEAKQASLEADIVKAENDLNTAKINYEVGNITKLQYEQAALGVDSAKNELEKNTRSYTMLKFSMDHPFMLVGGGA